MNSIIETQKEIHFQGPPFSLISGKDGGVFVFYGDLSLFSLTPLLAAWRLNNHERVLLLDGNNSFSPYPLVQLAKEMGHDPEHFLSSLFVSRAFTCHQMASLVFNQLHREIAQHQPRLVILAGPLETFYDESVPFIEAKNLLLHLVTALGQSVPGHIFVILSPFPKKMAGRRTFFLSHMKKHATRVFRIAPPEVSSQTSIRIIEEKPNAQEWLFPIRRV